MSIRKRTWQTHKGPRTKWVVDYADQAGHRRHKTFDRKNDANDFYAITRVQLGKGTHVPESATINVKKAGEHWLAKARTNELERGTIEQYEQHLRLHIVPFIGSIKLSRLNLGLVSEFRNRLHADGRSPAMIRGVMRSLGSLIANAQHSGQVAHNVVRELPRGGNGRKDRHKAKLKVGEDIPSPKEVQALLAKAEGRWRPLLVTAVMTGLRLSELRGLRWDDVDLHKGELHVRQRADRYGIIGSPKSASGHRTVPLGPGVLKELREWKLKCPKKDGKLGLVFPNGRGNVELGGNIIKRGLIPTVIAAGLTRPVLDTRGNAKRDAEGRPIVEAKYTGMHTLRHFFASWCINRKVDAGLELPSKIVQERLGHSAIAITMDRYGHLFPRGDDTAELAKAERKLLG